MTTGTMKQRDENFCLVTIYSSTVAVAVIVAVFVAVIVPVFVILSFL